MCTKLLSERLKTLLLIYAGGDGGAAKPATEIMFDGWSDRYKRYPYLGLRVSYVDRNWNNCVVTVSFKVLQRHTADRMSSHVHEELKALVLTCSHSLCLQHMMVFLT